MDSPAFSWSSLADWTTGGLTSPRRTSTLQVHPDESWRSHQPASRVRWSPRKRDVAVEDGKRNGKRQPS